VSWLGLNLTTVVIYTDGSCKRVKGEKSHGGWAAILLCNGHTTELCGATEDTTNNRMELTAVIKALQSLPTRCNVFIHTDSQYLQKGILYWLASWKRRGWMNYQNEPVANKDLWQELDIENTRHKVSYVWVRGHDGDVYNERCDTLAVHARKTLAQEPSHG
jgi:ribonuclease HI